MNPVASDAAVVVPPLEAETDTIDLVGRSLDARLAEEWSHIRDGWSQMTFYLFDPESWR